MTTRQSEMPEAHEIPDLAENQAEFHGLMMRMPDVEYVKLSRELYCTVLKLRKAVHSTESIYEARDIVGRILKNDMKLATMCFDASITPEDTTVYCRSNPKVPEGYRLVGRVESKYRIDPEEFDPKAICSDDGLRWYLVSRVGEPGCRTLVAEPMETAI